MRVALHDNPEMPEFVYKGVLAYLVVSGMTCTVHACINSNGEYIIYDGTVFSTSTEEDIPPFAQDLVHTRYDPQGYTVDLGDNMVVAPPVSVPTWIGVYPD